MLFHTYLGTAQIAFDLLPCICIFFGNELCTPYICTRFIVMCLRGFTSCICICIFMHLQWPSPWWLGSSCLKSPNWTFPGHCMGEESELEWMPRNWTNERIHMCAHISENLFFSYTFLEHGFGNLGFRKIHCRPWYILYNYKSTDLRTNLKHLDKVLQNHNDMLNTKMCFVREIESSFFWSERECKFRNSTRPEIEMGESSEEISETVSPDLTHILPAAPYIAVFVHCICICFFCIF